jgi:hypothetical protein
MCDYSLHVVASRPRATVLQLPARPRVTVDDAQRHDSTVVSPVIAGLVAQVDWHG